MLLVHNVIVDVELALAGLLTMSSPTATGPTVSPRYMIT
jgi:hypothetical protein